jgi:AmmeMemoRadiSam system protein B
VREIESADHEWLDALETGDAEGFFDSFRAGENATNVCSIATIYCVMKALEGIAQPRLLTYGQSNSDDQSCLVSFCSVAFLKNGS